MFDLDKSVSQKTFVVLMLHAGRWPEESDNEEHCLELHKTPILGSAEESQLYADRVLEGQVPREVIGQILFDEFGATHWELKDIIKQEEAKDSKGMVVPRYYLKIFVEWNEVKKVKKRNLVGLYVRWVTATREPTPEECYNLVTYRDFVLSSLSKHYGYDFDFTLESLRMLDKYISEELSDAKSEEEISNNATLIGSYLVEVFEKYLHGRWMFLSNGRPVIEVRFRNIQFIVNVFSTIRKRLIDGEEGALEYSLRMTKKYIEKGLPK